MIHFLGMTLSAAQALLLGSGLASAMGFGLGYLVRDYQSWSQQRYGR